MTAAPHDVALPSLAIALDRDAMQQRFRTVGIPGDLLEATTWRHRAGDRCTIRYSLADGLGPLSLFGKIFRHDARGKAAAVIEMATASAADHALPQIMPVVAFFDDLDLVVFEGCVGAREFHPMCADPTIDPTMRRAGWRAFGAAIAALHGSTIANLPRHSYDADLAELVYLNDNMRQLEPDLAARHSAIITRLVATRSAVALSVSPVHGSLRTDQVLFAEDRVVLLDLDSAGRADPGLDIGNLIAYLRWKVIRDPQRGIAVEDAIDSFTSGYSRAGAIHQRSVDVFTAAALLKIAGRRASDQQRSEWPLVPQLLDAADDLIAV